MVQCEGTTRVGAQCKKRAKVAGRCRYHYQGSDSIVPTVRRAAKLKPADARETNIVVDTNAEVHASEGDMYAFSGNESEQDELFVRPWSTLRPRGETTSKKSKSTGKDDAARASCSGTSPAHKLSEPLQSDMKRCREGDGIQITTQLPRFDWGPGSFQNPRDMSAAIINQLETMCAAACNIPTPGHTQDHVVHAVINIQRRAVIRDVFEFGEMLTMLMEHVESKGEEEEL